MNCLDWGLLVMFMIYWFVLVPCWWQKTKDKPDVGYKKSELSTLSKVCSNYELHTKFFISQKTTSPVPKPWAVSLKAKTVSNVASNAGNYV